ncbi:MAG: hypothetical protein WCT31_02135 [Candidatus Micrarchaeia archaeon]|jgi:hypothetical protein
MLEIMIKNLEIIEVKDLLQHEQTIDANVLRLKEAMLNIGQLVDPLIVDKKSKAVLDGNHRLKVLELVKVPLAVCQMVDYDDPKIQMGGWFPVSERLRAADFQKAGIRAEKVDFEVGKQAIDKRGAAFMLVNQKFKECSLLEGGSYNLVEMIDAQKRVLEKINKSELLYIADDNIEPNLEKGETVLYRKNFTKKEVVAEALAKRPLPPKSTRHMIPDRIIRLNMRLGWLHQSKEEAKRYVDNIIHDRVYNGNVRRYTEPVIVIY